MTLHLAFVFQVTRLGSKQTLIRATMHPRSDSFNFEFYIKSVKAGKIPWDFFASLMKDLSKTLFSAQMLNDILLEELKSSLQNLSFEPIKNESEINEQNHEDNEESGNGFVEEYEHYASDLDQVSNPKYDLELEIANPTEVDISNSVVTKGLESEDDQKEKEMEGNLDQDCNDKPNEVSMDFEIPSLLINVSKSLLEGSSQSPDENEITQIFSNESQIDNDVLFTDKVFGCGQCEEAFERTQQLDDHISTQHDSKDKLLCHNCDKTFSRADKLKNHIRSVHDRIKDKSCDLCDYKTGDNWKLKRHIASLHEGKETGNIDTEVFSRAEKLKVNLKNKLCDKCDYKTGDNYKLKRHMATHEGIKIENTKSTQCNLCGKVLINSRLKRHIEVVHEKIRYQCDFCEKSFQKKFLLNNHVKSFHQGINPFQCQECDKKFVLQYKLNQHRAIVHENKYTCDICSTKFSCFSMLDKHKLKNH